MKYTLDIYQVNPTDHTSESIFRDLDPAAFQKYSAFGRYSMSVCTLPWLYRSPAKRFITLAFGPAMNHPYMQPNALRYVFCAINRTRNGKRIFLELPADLCLSVQVYQVLVTLQVKDCIGPLHGHIKQIIKDRPLSEAELNVMQDCLEITCPGLYWFAIMVQEERQEDNWRNELPHGKGYTSEETVKQDEDSPDTNSDDQSGAGGEHESVHPSLHTVPSRAVKVSTQRAVQLPTTLRSPRTKKKIPQQATTCLSPVASALDVPVSPHSHQSDQLRSEKTQAKTSNGNTISPR